MAQLSSKAKPTLTNDNSPHIVLAMDHASESEIVSAGRHIRSLTQGLNEVIFGQEELVELVVIGILARGHILLEGLPGLGKQSSSRRSLSFSPWTLSGSSSLLTSFPAILPVIQSCKKSTVGASSSSNQAPSSQTFVSQMRSTEPLPKRNPPF